MTWIVASLVLLVFGSLVPGQMRVSSLFYACYLCCLLLLAGRCVTSSALLWQSSVEYAYSRRLAGLPVCTTPHCTAAATITAAAAAAAATAAVALPLT